jgi:hypothetical protein
MFFASSSHYSQEIGLASGQLLKEANIDSRAMPYCFNV